MMRDGSHHLRVLNTSSVLSRHHVSRRLARLSRSLLTALAWCVALGSLQAHAQTVSPNVQFTNKAVDLSARGDLRVNPSTRAVELQVPLGGYPGRAGLSLPVMLSYSSKVWRIDYSFFNPGTYTYNGNSLNDGYTGVVARYAEHSSAGWTSSLGFPFFDNIPTQYYNEFGNPAPNANSCGPSGCYVIDRMLLLMPDGSSHELRSSDQPKAVGDQTPLPDFLYSVDSSRMRYQRSTQTLFMADGSRYLLAGHQYVDRNGNTLTNDSANNRWLDTLGRGITLPPLATTAGTYTYSLPGVGGTNVNYTFVWKNLGDAGVLTTAQPLQYTADSACPPGNGSNSPRLFQSDSSSRTCITNANTVFNPVVLYQIQLPTGQSYTLTYNVYGEIDKVRLPSGGYERYEYAQVGSISSTSFPYNQASRGVVNRFVSANGTGNDEVQWQYAGGPVTITAPDGSLSQRYLYGDANLAWGYSLDGARAGMAYDERSYSAPDPGTGVRQMLRRHLTEWSMTGSNATNQYAQQATRDARPTKVVDILLDTGGNALTATTTYEYDADLNQTIVRHYDYATVDQGTAQSGAISSMPVGTLVRTDETVYLVNDPNVAQATRDAYRARNLISLPSVARVHQGDVMGQVVSETRMRYDETGLQTYGGAQGWNDPGTGVRGNATTVSRWLDTTNTWIETHASYDVFGNAVSATDARGNVSQVAYSSTYQYAYPTSTASAVPDPTGNRGTTTPLTSSAIYDYSTGLVTSTTDANGQTTSYQYNDPLDRLTRVGRPDGGWTTYTYGTSTSAGQPSDYVLTRTALDASRYVDSYQFYDMLERPSRTFLKVDSSATPFSTTDTQYDALGRVWRVSNPYLTVDSTAAINPSGRWTTSGYDALGRVSSVTTPDGAVVISSYAGNTVTVTDQAGKQRRSVSDGLGRLVRVDEPDTGGSLGAAATPAQPTYYTYNALGNLRKVDQGGQYRYFMYDSLSRLIRSKNPEQAAGSVASNLTDPVTGNAQWSMAYGYDTGGNLTARVDARNITTTYTYDSLNRVTQTDHSDGTASNIFAYDLATNGRGRFSYAYDNTTSGGYNWVTSYDAMGRPLRHQTDFYLQTGWVSNFASTRTYDLAGNVTSQTYPSGHTATYSYDAAGRPSSFAGNLGDGTARTYSTGIQYDEAGRMTREQYGAQVPLYRKSFYNVRGQLFDTRLSSVNDTWDWNRGRIINYYSANHQWGGSGTDNNGDVVSVENWIPPANAALDQVDTLIEDKYTYDSLDRLSRVEEQRMSAASWGVWKPQLGQGYTYDRWGNRQIDNRQTDPVTYTYDQNGVQQTCVNINCKQFTKDAATNRLTAAGMAYDAAGNLWQDTYSANAAQRTYDAENRMTSEQNSATSVFSRYTYDGEGHRARRDLGGTVTWQIYGFDGELLAEYAGGAIPSAPQKEYGYRGGELLVTAEAGGGVNWLVADHLGTPRMVVDQTGSLSGIKRHDYLPFGEEIGAGSGGRTQGQGYIQFDGVRQRFTGQEHDDETGLDYFSARYLSSVQGRFTSVDPLMASARIWMPQSWNRYAYVLNNPLRYIDPLGNQDQDPNKLPKPDKDNKLVNPDGTPYMLPPETVTVKTKAPKTPKILGGGWGDDIAPTIRRVVVSVVGGGAAATSGGLAGAAGAAGGGLAGAVGAGGLAGGADGGDSNGNDGDNSNNSEDYPTIDPSQVRFSQDSISNTFQNGVTIDQLAEGLRNGSVPSNAVPPIRVVDSNLGMGADGRMHLVTLDNRRLEAFRRANVPIPYVRVPPEVAARELARKFTTKNGGTSIRVRRGRD